MRLTILGGSAASPNAGMGCSGYLVESGRTRLVLDLGPSTLAQLRRHADFRALDGIVVSHMHVDHVLDLLALRHALAYNPIKARAPIPVWLPPGGADLLARAVAPFDECDAPGVFAATVAVAEYDPNVPLPIGDLVVTFAPTVHYVPAWAMRVDTTGPSAARAALGYTGDTGPAAALAGFFADVGVVVAEATLLLPGPGPTAKRGSLTAREAGELARDAGAPTLVLTHLWEERGIERCRDEAAAAFGGRLEVARPGLVIEW